MIDSHGYRVSVGILLANQQGQVFLGKRVRQRSWQFPQGGINEEEEPEEALYRELWEEVGVQANKVEILSQSRQWLKYRIPKKLMRSSSKPICIGQKQKWFLLRFTGEDSDINLNASDKPEFDDWEWVKYWYPLSQVIHFKREVYRRALREFAPALFLDAVRKGQAHMLDNLV